MSRVNCIAWGPQAAFGAFILRMLGRRPWRLTIILAVAAGFGTTYLFGLLRVMLPAGLLGFV